MFEIGDKVQVVERGFTLRGVVTQLSGNLVWVKTARGTITTLKARVSKVR